MLDESMIFLTCMYCIYQRCLRYQSFCIRLFTQFYWYSQDQINKYGFYDM